MRKDVVQKSLPESVQKVLSIRRELEKITEKGNPDHEQAMGLLSQLRDIDMNFSILSNTLIGKTVNALRKSSSDSEVISLAKSLLKAWKNIYLADRKEEKDVNSKRDKSHHAHCTEKKSSNSKRAKNSESDKTSQLDHLKMASKKKSQEARETVEAWLPWVEDLICQLCQRSPHPEDQKWFKCTEHYRPVSMQLFQIMLDVANEIGHFYRHAATEYSKD